jgi:D-cysteine desulfhydrase family pyridoxal phosphate-dependent enzyme
MIDIPRLNIAILPTPIQRLDRLTSFLGGPELYVKRDDLTGLAMGGNKIRKLEFLLADAQMQKAKTVITAGALQSNHCRQTAATAAVFNMDCVLVLAGTPPSISSGNYLLDQLFSARVVWTSRSEREKTLEQVFKELEQGGKSPYLIPYGGTNPLGAVGYVKAMEELMKQGLQPDWIIFPTSSGGTQTGMVVGAEMVGFEGKVLGISVDEYSLVMQKRIKDLSDHTFQLLAEKRSIPIEKILVNDDYLGKGYGELGEIEIEAIRLFAKKEGLLLDPVYTGRAAGGMLDLIRKGFFAKGERVLFWHTGGTPALFADKYRDISD